MSLKNITLALIATLALSAAAFAGDTKFEGNRVTVASAKYFDAVVDSLKALVAKNGMMVMAEVNQGQMLSMTGMSLKATLFLVGNPTVGKRVFEQDHAAGLYIRLATAGGALGSQIGKSGDSIIYDIDRRLCVTQDWRVL